jgi:hypothetical protein
MALEEYELAYTHNNDLESFVFADRDVSELGPYITDLYTTGGEYWFHMGGVNSPEIDIDSLNEVNSYKGWYHIRNQGSEYELILPTRVADEDYEGSPLLTKIDWFRNNGFIKITEELIEQTTNSPITGCTNPQAVNYNPLATNDNGTCEFINQWFLGDIPPSRLTHLFTEGGELYDASNHKDYQGWYHIHSSNNLPNTVIAGAIMAGSDYWMNSVEKPPGQPDNFLLIPHDVDAQLYFQHMESSPYEYSIKDIHWHRVFNIEDSPVTKTFEDQNLQSIEARGTKEDPYIIRHADGARSEIIFLDNLVTSIDVKKMMAEVDYEFSELIPDLQLSPGIFGSKPKLEGDINIMNLSGHAGGSGTTWDKTKMDLGGNAIGPAAPDNQIASG